MTEYEIADLVATFGNNIMQGQAIFITIFSAYVVVAYTVGKQLTRFQVIFVSVAFLLFTISNTLSVFQLAEQAFYYADQMATVRGLEGSDAGARRMSNKSLFYGVRALLIMGALLFMWQVRRSQAD